MLTEQARQLGEQASSRVGRLSIYRIYWVRHIYSILLLLAVVLETATLRLLPHPFLQRLMLLRHLLLNLLLLLRDPKQQVIHQVSLHGAHFLVLLDVVRLPLQLHMLPDSQTQLLQFELKHFIGEELPLLEVVVLFGCQATE